MQDLRSPCLKEECINRSKLLCCKNCEELRKYRKYIDEMGIELKAIDTSIEYGFLPK
jgi:hypothetical protein